MSEKMEQLYQERLKRYVAAMRNEKPDRIPIRPFAAEFAGKYAGYTCQQVTHDFDLAFAAVRQCAADFNWDATVGNMVYVWTGLVDSVGTKYYHIPGVDCPPDSAFQYIEPKDEENAYMRADEYDLLIEDPTGFLANVWMPRVNLDVAANGQPNTFRNNLSWLKGGMGMLTYFNKFGEQNARLRAESGTVGAISGCLKSPFDILADKLRGFIPLCSDLFKQPKKVEAACEALMPHMMFNALAGADPSKNVPISIWLHRGCVPFISYEQFERFSWPMMKQIIEEIWKLGHQVLFYAEGDWDRHLQHIAKLPERSIIYHVDRGDIFAVHKAVGHKFCLSGGIPNELLTFGTPDEVREYCKRVIDGVAQDGGYIMDAGAIMQDDPQVENVKAMTDFTVEYGVY
ncbi:MAG: uroporphyrinogen decarboxylase family protein [Candidatus Omnitrophota bacterium]